MLDGLAQGQVALGVDIGAAEDPSEPVLKMVAAEEPVAASDATAQTMADVEVDQPAAPAEAQAATGAALDAVADEPAAS